jgi:hypothetical protein
MMDDDTKIASTRWLLREPSALKLERSEKQVVLTWEQNGKPHSVVGNVEKLGDAALEKVFRAFAGYTHMLRDDAEATAAKQDATL